MDFTFKSYINLIHLLKENNYTFSDYTNWDKNDRTVIMRHDIDTSVEKALEMANIEKKEQIAATYFVLVSSDFYNIHSLHTANILDELRKTGAKIGLHFDEMRYKISGENDLIAAIHREKEVLEDALGSPVDSISMHRPSKWILDDNIQVPGMVNAYSTTFLNEFKYVSDSRMHWREDVELCVKSNQFSKLCILTHAFWYQSHSMSTKEILLRFINSAKEERYRSLAENIRDIDEFITSREIEDI